MQERAKRKQSLGQKCVQKRSLPFENNNYNIIFDKLFTSYELILSFARIFMAQGKKKTLFARASVSCFFLLLLSFILFVPIS